VAGKAEKPLGRMSRAALWAAGATLIGGGACEKTTPAADAAPLEDGATPDGRGGDTPIYGAPAPDAASLEAGGATPDGRASDASADIPADEVSPGADAGLDSGRDVRDSGFSNDRGVVALYGAVAAPNT
jgi:hypothetical protein